MTVHACLNTYSRSWDGRLPLILLLMLTSTAFIHTEVIQASKSWVARTSNEASAFLLNMSLLVLGKGSLPR